MKTSLNIILMLFAFSTSAQLCDPNLRSIQFDGTSYISYGNNNNLNLTEEMSIEAWIFSTSWASTPSMGSIVCKHGWTMGEKGYALRAGGNGQLSFVISGVKSNGMLEGWQEVLSQTGDLQLNTWHHVAGTFDGNKLRLYIDGNQVGTKSFNGKIVPSVDYNLHIGRVADDGAANGRYWIGLIDEVRIWSKKLSTNEITASMNVHINGQSASNLVGYWQFNETQGNNVPDKSPSGNDGTIFSGSWNTNVPFTNGILHPSISQIGSELFSSSLIGNQWNLNGIPIPGETRISITPNVNGNYSVTATLPGGCIATSPIVQIISLAIGENSPRDIFIQYTYINDILYVRCECMIDETKLFDMQGRAVSTFTTSNNELRLPNLSPGIYLISTKTGSTYLKSKLYLGR